MKGFILTAALVSSLFGTTQVAQPGNAQKGSQVFKTYGCAGCHSLDGTPRVGPSLRGVTQRLSLDQISKQIRQPPSGSPMPSIKLTAEELRDLLAFLQQQ